MSNSDIDLSRPLLQDDELAYDEELSSNGFEEDLKRTTRLEALRTALNTFWRYHRRRVVLGLSCTSAAALTLLVLFIVFSAQASDVDIDVPEWNETLAYDPRLEKYQSPEDWQLCPSWSPPQPLSDSSPSKYTSTVSFSLPTTPDLTFFLTRGSPIVGTFTLHEERAQGDEITVDVIAEYDDINEGQDVLGSTKACCAWRKEGGLWEQGVLLWADPSLADSTHVHYNISVRLPNINVFNEISTDFTNPGSVVDQFIGGFFDIWRPTGFGPVRLNSRDAPIKVQTLMGSEMYVSTTNARVDGHFWVTKGAYVQTSNAPVFSTVWAIGHEQGANISTSIRTNNGPVFAALTIASDFTHIKLNASIHTTNGNLTIISPRAMVTPYPSVYLLSGSTTNAPIQVHLHPEYEGTFDLRTVGPVWEGRTDLVWDNEAAGRDPAGEGRTRKLDWEGGRNERRRKSGRIFWGEPEDVKEERMGDIKLWTTRKDVLLVAQRGPVDRGLS